LKYFKFKDFFTSLNLFLSFYAVVLAFEGRFELGSYLLVFNVLVLDIVDGLVARLTKTGNEFGKHFDSITDFLGSSVVVSFFIYIALKNENIYIAIACAFLFLLVGVVREIQQRLENISHKGYFVGFPRNAAAILIVAFFNTTLYDLSPYILIPYLALLCFCQLSHIPYVGNDKKILLEHPRMKFYLLAALVYLAVNSYFGFFWNVILTYMCCFLLTPYFVTPREVWDGIKEQQSRLKA